MVVDDGGVFSMCIYIYVCISIYIYIVVVVIGIVQPSIAIAMFVCF